MYAPFDYHLEVLLSEFLELVDVDPEQGSSITSSSTISSYFPCSFNFYFFIPTEFLWLRIDFEERLFDVIDTSFLKDTDSSSYTPKLPSLFWTRARYIARWLTISLLQHIAF